MLNSPLVLLLIATLCWAGNVVLAKVATLGYVPPFALSFWRWMIALAILLPFAWSGLKRVLPALQGHWPLAVLLAVLSVASYNTSQYWALQHTSALNAAVVIASMPGFMFLATWIAGQERAGPLQIAGLAAVTLGALVVAFHGSLERVRDLAFNIGDLAMLYSVATWVLYSVLLRRLPKGLDPLGLQAVFILAGLPAIAPFWIWELWSEPLPRPSLAGLGIVLYTAIFPAIVAYLAWNRAVALGGANLAGIMNNLAGVFAMLFAVTLLGERLLWYHVAGALLIFAGIYLAAIRGRRPARA